MSKKKFSSKSHFIFARVRRNLYWQGLRFELRGDFDKKFLDVLNNLIFYNSL
jgi:hypothetical protein